MEATFVGSAFQCVRGVAAPVAVAVPLAEFRIGEVGEGVGVYFFEPTRVRVYAKMSA
jgi:hypothetical protein